MDGTLVHSAPDLVDALNHTIAKQNMKTVNENDIGYLAGQGAMAMLEKTFKMQKKMFDEKQKEKMLETFIEHYTHNIANKTKLYNQCLECLDELEKEKWIFAICTNKREELAKLLLEKLGEKNRFKCVVGGDTIDVKKPDGKHILYTIEQANGDREKAIMIGDSINDIRAAKDAGVKSIAVGFGYSEHNVETLGADAVIRNFGELVEAIKNIEKKWK